jgi:hypothetical protein
MTNLIKPKKIKNEAGRVYYFKDFFIHTFYQILEPLSDKIKNNSKSLIFPRDKLKEQSGYFINNFTGAAFERLLKHALEFGPNKYPKLFSKLDLSDKNFDFFSHTDSESQIDLIIQHKKDRICRIIEAKWINKKNIKVSDLCDQVAQKNFIPQAGFLRKNYLLLSFDPTVQDLKIARKKT